MDAIEILTEKMDHAMQRGTGPVSLSWQEARIILKALEAVNKES